MTIPSDGDSPAAGSMATVRESSLSYADCSGQHLGEVVAFRLGPASGGDPASSSTWCADVAAGYQSSGLWRFLGASGDYWTPVESHIFIAILNESGEAPWGACAVLAPGLELYSGSYVASLPGLLPAPAPFGSCRTDETSQTWTSCTSPHRVQEFGVAIEAGTSSPQAVDACGQLVQSMTGMPDVQAGGLFKIQLVSGGSTAQGGDFGGPGLDAEDSGRCRLIAVGPNQLHGTLIGIGMGSLPLS